MASLALALGAPFLLGGGLDPILNVGRNVAGGVLQTIGGSVNNVGTAISGQPAGQSPPFYGGGQQQPPQQQPDSGMSSMMMMLLFGGGALLLLLLLLKRR